MTTADRDKVREALGRTDKLGRTALHAALLVPQHGDVYYDSIGALIKSGAPVETPDHEGILPIHLAAAAGSDPLVSALINERPSCRTARDSWGRSAADFASSVGFNALAQTLLPDGESLRAAYMRPNPLPTMLLAHPACLLHTAPVGPLLDSLPASTQRMLYGQPECAERLRTMLGPYGTLRASRFGKLSWRAAPRAALADVLRCHEASYVRALDQQCAGLAERALLAPEVPQIGKVDPDTEVNEHSFEAALHGAGAVIEAVRAVCGADRSARNAFCAVRPPGHHSGPRGAVGGQTAGFCLLSAAAIGAAHALNSERERIKKVAIVDFDVHHGNGTEACVRNVVPTQQTERFDAAVGTLSVSRLDWKPWLSDDDAQNVFFGSIHGFGVENDEEDGVGDVVDLNSCFYPGSGGPGTDSSAPAVLNTPMPLNTPTRPWRLKMTKRLLVPLRAFNPDLVIISAGFDAHAHDPLQARLTHIYTHFAAHTFACVALRVVTLPVFQISPVFLHVCSFPGGRAS